MMSVGKDQTLIKLGKNVCEKHQILENTLNKEGISEMPGE